MKKKILQRYVGKNVEHDLESGKSVLLLGPRQVGKSTLMREIIGKKYEMERVLLQDPTVRIRLEQDPGCLIRDIKGSVDKKIIFVDEVQKVPALLDSVQYLIDEDGRQFVLTGSSARKLRRQQVNLLPGRVLGSRMDPLMWGELGLSLEGRVPELKLPNINDKKNYGWKELSVYGSLPEVVGAKSQERQRLLLSYATIYLEEEIRAEAISRNVGVFRSFLQLVAQESGGSPNLTKLSEQTGVSLPTVRGYLEVLQDTLVLEELPIYSKKVSRQIAGRSKYYLFDVGVRNALIEAPLALELANVQKGVLFEHMVVLEMMRRKRLLQAQKIKLSYWRTRSGAEVGLVVEVGGKTIPMEIKAKQNVVVRDVSGLVKFMQEHQVEQGYVITLDERPQKISDKIMALPWNYL